LNAFSEVVLKLFSFWGFISKWKK